MYLGDFQMQFSHKLNSTNYDTPISMDASFVLNNVNLIFTYGEDIPFNMYIIMLMFSKEIYFNAFLTGVLYILYNKSYTGKFLPNNNILHKNTIFHWISESSLNIE